MTTARESATIEQLREALQGRYELGALLGRGGSAMVLAARRADGEPAAVKILSPVLTASVQAQRFAREMRLVAGLDHPRITRLIECEASGWLLWYSMALVEGPTVRERLRGGAILPVPVVGRLGLELLEALEYAHARGIVHRDVKPENVILSSRGAVLVDFGIARAVMVAGSDRITRSGLAVGTAAYMSPEQIDGDTSLDGRTDLYALGCLLYEALAGHPPYDGVPESLLLLKHHTTPIPDLRAERPDVPPEFATTLHTALAKDPASRWSSATAMAAALRGSLSGIAR